MLGINSNINSLVAQQNLNGSQNALSQAITRLSSGKRINSAADDAAGLAISTRMQTQINGLNQGVSNANDGVSMIQTATSGLSQITSSLQRIRQLAVQASSGSLSASDQQALQQEVTQQIAEVNRIASQTNYNGKNVLDGSAGNISFQVGANVGQSISLNLTQSLSASSLGAGVPQKGATLGTYTGLSLDATTGAAWGGTGPATLTSINVISDGNGGFTFTDQNNKQLGSAVQAALFSGTTTGSATNPTSLTLTPAGALAASTNAASQAASAAAAATTINTISGANITQHGTGTDTAAGTKLGELTGLSLNADGTAYTGSGTASITSIQVYADGAGGFQFTLNGADPTVASNVFKAGDGTTQTAAIGTVLDSTTTANAISIVAGSALATGTGFTVPSSLSNVTATTTAINANNVVKDVSQIDISSSSGAAQAMEAIDNALATVNNIQATLGAAQNRFTAISTTQQAQSTNLSQAQSQIQDANFAQETANLSKAQVLQQAGISVLAQANSLPQQVLKLLQ
ncbi:flagellin [Burkholderia multivorans]|uniref:flagellin N-terminal helical domain-containing protein n=1 Tax=Burkholderia multivorans TaxID=87883 RepID=UPI001C24EABD|nr:flagellin [Burkholderia multivorans]MBU9223929.1 flagellin [Burkholderia multivorans]MBU9419218.1 flagellin [Burkholderia multivorans]MBU9478922.1 flagellin [Burkholderia multivorans]MDN7968797.1 flagellin [Burkholderia multivorans]